MLGTQIQILDVFFNQDDVKDKLAVLTESKFASYKKPFSSFQNIINILGVSRSKKVVSCSGSDSKNCELLNTYKAWKDSKKLVQNVKNKLTKAVAKCKQPSISSFCKKEVSVSTKPQLNNNGLQPSNMPSTSRQSR